MFMAVTIAPVIWAMPWKIEHIALILMNVLKLLMDATSMQHVPIMLVHTHVLAIMDLVEMGQHADWLQYHYLQLL